MSVNSPIDSGADLWKDSANEVWLSYTFFAPLFGIIRRFEMFQSLTDQQTHASSKEWMVRAAAIALISALLFLALYLGVRSAG